jgi:hypothetical protein
MDLPEPRAQSGMYVDPPCPPPSHQEHVKSPLDAAGSKKHRKMKGIDGVLSLRRGTLTLLTVLIIRTLFSRLNIILTLVFNFYSIIILSCDPYVFLIQIVSYPVATHGHATNDVIPARHFFRESTAQVWYSTGQPVIPSTAHGLSSLIRIWADQNLQPQTM